jgi:hypothetical protein
MAISSGIFLETFDDIMRNVIALDLDAETHKGALFNDTLAPDFDTNTAYGSAPLNANEVYGGAGWPQGGVALTGTLTDITTTSQKFIFDADNVQETPTDLTAAMGYLLYAAGLSNEAIVLIDFVSQVDTTNGQIDITWADPGSGGIFNIDLVP